MVLDQGRIRWALALLLAVMVAGFLPGVLLAGDFGDALIGWWKFDEGGGLVAADAGGLGNDGMLGGSAEFTSDSLLGGAVDFTEEDGAVVVPWDESLEPATGTFQAWIKVGELHDADIVAKTTDRRIRTDPNNAVSLSVYGLRIRLDGGLRAFIGNDDTNGNFWTILDTPADLIQPNTWHQLAMRWDGTMLAVFCDGVIEAEAYYFAIPDTGLSYSGERPLYLGAATAGTYGGEFIGQMDDVRFYGRGRTDKEIFVDFMTRGRMPAKPAGQ